MQLIVNSPRELRLPLPGRGDQPCHFVPIDYVIEAGLAIADNPDSVGRTFHIADERPTSLARVFDLINEAAERPPAPSELHAQSRRVAVSRAGLDRLSQVPEELPRFARDGCRSTTRATARGVGRHGHRVPERHELHQDRRAARAPSTGLTAPRLRKLRRDPHFEELDDPLDA